MFGRIGAEVKRNPCSAPYSTCTNHLLSRGQTSNLWRSSDISSAKYPGPFYNYLQRSGFFNSKSLLAENNTEPVASPLTPILGDSGKAEKAPICVRSQVQAIKKGIRQSPKKVNLVAQLVRGMRVDDALLQLQVLVKRAAKTVYQVIHSARANATHNHGMDADKLLVAEAFVGKGLYLKRVSYHSKGRSGIMMRPKCRLTVVVRETTAEEEAKIARLKVSNYKKLSKQERRLVPHQLIETTPKWSRKIRESTPN